MKQIISPRGIAALPDRLPVRSARLSGQRVGFASALIIPAVGAIAAPIVSAHVGYSWVEPTTFLLMITITGLGIEAGYHRLFAHQSFQTTPWIRVLLLIAGSTACQGPLLYWVAHHRLHHGTSDEPEDPHTPYHHPRGRVAGFLFAHVGWFFVETRASPGRFARDLLNDRTVMAADRHYLLWLMLSLALPAAIGGIGTWSWSGAMVGFLWGGLMRLFISQHLTYFVNSLCHVAGSHPYMTTDHAGNIHSLAIPSYGATLHNNHHAFPRSATYDFRWWHIDLSGWFIRSLAWMGLAWDLKHPGTEEIARRTR